MTTAVIALVRLVAALFLPPSPARDRGVRAAGDCSHRALTGDEGLDDDGDDAEPDHGPTQADVAPPSDSTFSGLRSAGLPSLSA